MVSRHRASRIIVIESIINETRESRNRATYGLGSNTSDSLWTRRPAIGIQIENSIFFSLHAASAGDYNEAQLLVTMIENYVLQFHPGATTLIMGDFNRSPQSLENALVPLPDNTISRRIVSIPQSTQQSGGILDYAVWLSGVAITATAVLGASFLTRGGAVSTSSDHFPVRFCAS
uniref:Endonuclease/exonuclease/phosphatase domain-containing protein n=1 Tax=Wolbachia endosymbiont of Oeneis ivallda TaxID=3171168 RepID=A0AAU7YLG6_9RICK